MRRLISFVATLLMVGALVPVSMGSAAAGTSGRSAPIRCWSWSGGTLSAANQQSVRRARAAVDDVFEGRVSLPAKAKASAKASLPLRVQVLATWKGSVQPQTTVTVHFRPGACRTWALAHPRHEEYLFFTTRTSGGQLEAAGDVPRVVPHTAALVQVLGPASGGVSPSPAPVTFTPTGAPPPRSFLKVAAPGIALLIIGLLGLLVVRRLGRRAM